ncbi:MAG: glycosyltransferase [Firmicutes bacterium]|nr:glycosyltransferase [Bacillota bacterium]
MSNGTIIYIGGFELPNKNASANRVYANSMLFTNLGYKTVLIGIKKNSIKNEVTYSKIDEFDVWERTYPIGKLQWLKFMMSIKPVVKIIEKYSDVKAIICYNYHSLPFVRILRYCRKRNIKIISDTTEWYTQSDNNYILKSIKTIDSNLRMKVVNKKVDALILSSQFLSRYYKKNLSVVIPTLIYTKDDITPVYNSSEITRIIYAGTPFELGKKLNKRSLAKDRLDIAIKLVHNAFVIGKKDIVFDIYGLTKEQYLEVLPEDQEIVNVSCKYIRFHGKVDNFLLQKEIAEADFSILLRESNITSNSGFPTKFTESIKLNVPVITTKTSDLENYLVDGKNGFFLNLNSEDYDLNKFISILSQNNQQKNTLKDYCYQTNVFDYTKWEIDIEDFFKKVGV